MIDNYTPYQLDPEFYDRLRSLQNRVPDIRIASGYRSDFQQQQLRDAAQAKDMNPDDWFAPAGESSHNYGIGADLTGNLADVHRYAPLYGLFHALTQDPWHIEPAYVSEKGLPYRPTPQPVHVDYLSTAPTGDKGLDANLQNQADARAAAARGTVPAGIPKGMLDPSLRMNLPDPRTGATVMDPAGAPVTQLAGDLTTQSEKQKQAAADTGVSPDQPKQTPVGVGSAPDLSSELPAAQGASDQQNQLTRNRLQSALNQNATDQNRFNAAAASSLSTGGTAAGAAIVNAMMSQVGKPYSTSGRFGPNAFDCSGITVYGLRMAGIDPGGNVVSTTLQQWGTPVDLQTAMRTPGAMLFVWGQGAAGHVEVSRGDGTTIGSSSGGVQVRSAMNRGWTGAALPPGVGVGNAGAQPVSLVPNRVLPAPDNVAKYAMYTIARAQDIMKRGGGPGSIPTPVSAPTMGPTGSEMTTGQPPLVPDKVTEQAQQQQAAASTLPPGAPAPASQPGNPNPVSAPVAVAPGQTPQQAEQDQVALPKDVQAGSGQGIGLGAAANAEGKTAIPGGITPEQAAAGQFPVTPAAQPGQAGGNFANNLDGWIQAAMHAEGVDPALFPYLRQAAMRESSGNPNAVNNSDINAQHGDPSRGVMQLTGASYATYGQGLGPINDPISNIRAMIRYVRGENNRPYFKGKDEAQRFMYVAGHAY